MELQNLHDQFCQESFVIRNCSKATVRWYVHSFRRYRRHCNGQLNKPTDINTENLRSFLFYGRLECKWTADTFLHYYKGLKAFLKWCVAREYL
ncbi:MAG: phage integrase N-terminal SAM-like domain-containing protein, partial [Candidatus Gracilibacteria bacterium]